MTSFNSRMSLAEKLIRSHEGTGPIRNGRYQLYKCPAGKFTVAIGRNIQDKGLSEDEVNLMLSNDIKETVGRLSKFRWWDGLSENRKAALIDMGFNLGQTKFSGFKKMIASIGSGDFKLAAINGLDSKWARDVPLRAKKLMKIIETDSV